MTGVVGGGQMGSVGQSVCYVRGIRFRDPMGTPLCHTTNLSKHSGHLYLTQTLNMLELACFSIIVILLIVCFPFLSFSFFNLYC